MAKFIFDENCLDDDELLYKNLSDLCSIIISRHFYANHNEREDLMSVGIIKALEMLNAGHWDPFKGRLMSFLYSGIRNDMHNYLYRVSREVLCDEYHDDSRNSVSIEDSDVLSIDYKLIDEVCSFFSDAYGDMRDFVVMNLEDNGFRVINYEKTDFKKKFVLPKLWAIRAGQRGEINDLFLDGNLVALGWNGAGDVYRHGNREILKKSLYNVFPDKKKKSVELIAGQLYRFSHNMAVGDYAIYPSKKDRSVYVGKVLNNYEYNSKYDKGFPHVRNVRWLSRFGREEFSQKALNGLGSFLRFFSMHDYAKEFYKKIGSKSTIMLVDRTQDFHTKPKSFQDDLINRLSGAVLWKSREYSHL